MTPGSSSQDTVLVVEDETHLADLYADFLSDTYEVRVAHTCESAIDALSPEVDAMLLDRRLPDRSGDEVLSAVKRGDHDCRVAMITAVDPDFDIIDLGLDDYLVKPVGKEDVREVVDRLLSIAEFGQRHRELTSKKLKRNVLRVEKSDEDLAASDRYRRLQTEIEELESRIDELAGDLTEDDLMRVR